MSAGRNSEISNAILSYLLEHPDAQDTLEGIVKWWLVAHMIESRTNVVKEVVADLTSRRLLIQHQGRDLCPRYRINRSKFQEIRRILDQGDNQT
jgi:hypothetical protein